MKTGLVVAMLVVSFCGGMVGNVVCQVLLKKEQPAAPAIFLEPDWDVNTFISASEQKRREALQAARQSEAFQKAMAAAHEQMEKSFIEDHLGFCEVEIEGLVGKGNPQIYDALANELKRRGFDNVRFCESAFSGKYIMRIGLPERPWRP